jgi:hypothetical protein
MLRVRCDVARSAASLRLTVEVCTARRWASGASPYVPVGPYGLTVPVSPSSAPPASSSSALMSRCWRQHSGATLYFSPSSSLTSARRFARVAGKEKAEADEQPAAEQQQTSQSHEDQSKASTDDAKDGDKGSGEAGDENKKNGFLNVFSQIREDFTKFPDIYNSINLLNFVLFTVFCLCSTGSNVESEWWLEHWGIDAAFRPWAWALHSLLTNNFLSMAFAMMMIHGMCTSAISSVGAAGLMQYLAIVSVVSGVLMWAFNASRGYTKEKQFGPWDITAALFVMQFFHQGFKPWQILNSFSGWQKYAMWVGAFCIMYYDYQPVVCGTALGLALIKFHPKFKAPAVAAA